MGADLTVVSFDELTSTARDIPFERLGLVSAALQDFNPADFLSYSTLFPTHKNLPNTADLHFVKNVLRAGRQCGVLKGPHTKDLTSLAKSLGHKTFASLMQSAPSAVQNPAQRECALVPMAVWALHTLGVTDLHVLAAVLETVVSTAARIPVFQYTYKDISGHVPREHRIFSAGFLVDIGPQTMVAHPLDQLGLLAVDYEVSAPRLPETELTFEQFEALSKAQQLEHYQCAYMRNPTVQVAASTLQQYALVADYLEPGFNYWLQSDALKTLYGTDRLMMNLPDYGYTDTLQTCTHVVTEGKVTGFFKFLPEFDDIVGTPVSQEEIRTALGLDSMSVRRLMGSAETMATYVVELPAQNLSLSTFGLDINFKGRYCAEEAFWELARTLIARCMAKGLVPLQSQVLKTVLAVLAEKLNVPA